MAWVITQDEVLYLSTEHHLGPHIWSEPGVACWSLESDRVVVPEGCYHATLNAEGAERRESQSEAKRVACAANSTDLDGQWHPMQVDESECAVVATGTSRLRMREGRD